MNGDSSTPLPAGAASASAASLPPENRISKKATGVIGMAVAFSRVLGLARELIFAKLFGAGYAMDIFFTAFRIPNLLRDLFAEGALSTAFVTVFSKKIATDGEDAAWRLANKMATLTVVFMSAITLVGVAASPSIVRLMTSGFGAEKMAHVIDHTQIMFPFILLVSLAALAMGMLNAKRIFGMPAMASSFFNLGSIAGGVAIGYWLDPRFGIRALMGLSIGTLIGGLLQLIVQFPSLHRAGFRFRPDFAWRDEGVRRILGLMGPAVIAASAVQVNVMVNTNFASHLPGNGPVSWLSYAFRVMQLPLGMFGVALGTVTLPVVSRFAATHDWGGVRSTLARGMRLSFLLTVPCALGLALLAEPIIGLLYQRGAFHFESTQQCAAALRFYALGLVAYSGIKVLAPAFYALDRRNLPMMVSFFSIATNYALNQFFTFHLQLGHRGLALSTSIVAAINFFLLYGLMVRQMEGLESKALLALLGRLALAVTPMTLLCLASRHWVFAELATMSVYAKALGLAGTIALAGGSFVGMAAWVGIDEVAEVAAMARRKLARRA
jgi:putative peptidoglycan lipid II flippase